MSYWKCRRFRDLCWNRKNLLLDNNNGNTIEEMIEYLKNYLLPIGKINYFTKKQEMYY